MQIFTEFVETEEQRQLLERMGCYLYHRKENTYNMLYIMRHGKTDWNALHKMQGRTDIPLNEEGRKMAEDAGEQYRELNFDVCYCPPLVRARETAEIFLKGREVPIIIDKRLEEMSFGIYEGIANSFQIPDCPVNKLFYDPANYEAVEGGESLEQLYARTGEFIKQVVEPGLTKGKDILIIGHGAMNASIICQIKNMSLEHFWDAGCENCKLIRLV